MKVATGKKSENGMRMGEGEEKNGGAEDRITDEISMNFVSMETKKEPHDRLWHEVQDAMMIKD